MAGLIYLWNQASSFIWVGPVRERTIYIEPDYRVMTVSNPVRSLRKDPAAILDYTQDWRTWLNGDTLDPANPPVWSLTAGISNAGTAFSSTTATIWLSGGTNGVSYQATVTIHTTGGRTDVRTFQVNVVSS